MDKAVGAKTSVRFVVAAVVAGALGLFTSRIIDLTGAAASVDADPHRALGFSAHQPAALVALAQRALANDANAPADAPPTAARPALALARRYAMQAFEEAPFTPGALTILARIVEAQGNTSQARSLMTLAARSSLRDGVAQGWLTADAIKTRDFSGAASAFDVFLRTHPEDFAHAVPLLAAFVVVPQANSPLLEVLAGSPSWRADFFKSIPSAVGDRRALAGFFAAAEASALPPNTRELQSYVDLLVKDGALDQAHAIWAASLPADRDAATSRLYNGGFQYPLTGAAFDWRIERALGADVVYAPSPGGGVLSVDFSGANVDFRNVSHLLVLPPGPYSLHGEFSAQDLQTTRGLWWRISCVSAPAHDQVTAHGPATLQDTAAPQDQERVLGHSNLISQASAWAPLSFDFNVPASGCDAQVLNLELPARIALEKRIAGEVSFRNFAIEPALRQ